MEFDVLRALPTRRRITATIRMPPDLATPLGLVVDNEFPIAITTEQTPREAGAEVASSSITKQGA